MDESLTKLILTVLLIGGGAVVELVKRARARSESDETIDELRAVDEEIRKARQQAGPREGQPQPQQKKKKKRKAQGGGGAVRRPLPAAAAYIAEEAVAIPVASFVPAELPPQESPAAASAVPKPRAVARVPDLGGVAAPHLQELREAFAWREAFLPPLALREGEPASCPGWSP